MELPLEGGCLCGAIRYRIDATPLWVNLCYCRSCTKAAGAPVMAHARMPAAGFAMLAGEPQSFSSSAGVSRFFCATCGTSLFVRGDHVGADTVIAVATLDRPEQLPPTLNVHTAARIRWMPPNPNLDKWRGDDDRPKP